MDDEDNVKQIIDAFHERNEGEKTHSRRIMSLCLRIGAALQLPPNEMALLERAAYLHDIGKIFMEDVSLKRSAQLSEVQREEKREHPKVGYDLLIGYGEPKAVVEAVLHHHEEWSGTGYPDGLIGEAITLFARIIAVAEYADALTLQAERLVATDDNVTGRMEEQAGKRLDPTVVCAYLAAVVQ